MFKDVCFSQYFHSPELLANEVLKIYFDTKEPSFPIDPFDILKEFDVIYKFQEFKDIEGIYIVPEDDDDIPIVGINIKRPLERQRFTASHELCHHIKDRLENSYCPINAYFKSPIEKFSDSFAGELLAPKEELKRQAEKYEENGKVSFENVLYISDYFGISFESCVFNLAYKLNKIDGDISAKEIKKRVKKFKPDKRRAELGLDVYDVSLLENTVNSYIYFFENNNDSIWYNFKTNFIYNESRLEGVNLERDEIAELLTDARIKGSLSKHYLCDNKDIVEALGHNLMYEYLVDITGNPSVFNMLKLHKLLYEYAPFPEMSGNVRTSNNRVSSAKFETTDYSEIWKELLIVEESLKNLIENKDKLIPSEYISKAVKVHHRLTAIHPFDDGNGRVSRIMLNWIFKVRGLPPVYLNAEKKIDYYNALESADMDNDYTHLNKIFYQEMFKVLIELNKDSLI